MLFALVGRALGVAAVAALAASPVALARPPVELPPLPTSEAASSAQAGGADAGGELVGTFRITAGTCDGDPAGTWFRMIQPGGTASGPYVNNTDSTCDDQTYTPLAPGRDGGLVTGAHQEQPDPAFDSGGNGVADAITEPQRFFGVDFATATNPTDPQSGTDVPAPSVTAADDGSLGGDLRAFAASWNNQHFNQGAPKPDGSMPGATSGPTGTYDAATGAFVLEWTSQIVGGPFNNFTGQWHLEGTFAATTTASAQPSPARPAASTATASSATASSGGAVSALADTGPTSPPLTPLVAFAAGAVGLALARGASRARRA